jgi:hypothetical protein
VPPVHVFIVHAHPERRSLNSELKNVAVSTLSEAGHEVQVSDLYAMHWRPEADGRDFPEHPADAEQAANTLAEVKVRQLERSGEVPTEAEIAAIRRDVQMGYERQASAYYCTSELWDDGLLDPVDTRNALGIAISCALNVPIGEPRYGVLRL